MTTQPNRDQLTETMEKKSNEQLEEMFKNPSDWTPIALESAANVLKSRNITPPPISSNAIEDQPPPSSANRRDIFIGLLFLLPSLLIFFIQLSNNCGFILFAFGPMAYGFFRIHRGVFGKTPPTRGA